MSRYATDLRQRAKLFAVDVYRLSKHIRERHPSLRSTCDQLFDSASREFIAMMTTALKKLRP